jgi:branched-chain amino acid transport system permease protein
MNVVEFSNGKTLAMSKPLLKISDLHKNFGGIKAIDGVNLEVFDREIVGVIGPNGSGKTTTFNVVTGLIPASSGSIRWDDDDELVGLDPWAIFKLGIARTFQNIRLPLGLSVIENVMVGLFLEERSNWMHVIFDTRRLKARKAEMRDRAEAALRFVSPALSLAPERLVAELSYADRRRVEIARAIVSRPRLILLDEPTAGMNASETDELGDDVRKVNQSGITVVLVEHKMKFISDLADRVVVLNFGQKIAEDSYDRIRSNEMVIEAYLGRRRAAQA